MMIFDMMKNLVLVFLFFQADVDVRIIKTTSDQREVSTKNINELKNKIKSFSDNDKFFVILMDEIKIQSNFVWDKRTGELIGYVDLVTLN